MLQMRRAGSEMCWLSGQRKPAKILLYPQSWALIPAVEKWPCVPAENAQALCFSRLSLLIRPPVVQINMTLVSRSFLKWILPL